jgi:hypothetical protein
VVVAAVHDDEVLAATAHVQLTVDQITEVPRAQPAIMKGLGRALGSFQ